jgi:O-antigen/teichoic acid export membrane protein
MTQSGAPAEVRERSVQPESDGTLSRKHIRGSSLLLTGRVLSMVLKFVFQVLIVRYLSRGDYGAWTYALAAVTFFKGFAVLGLTKTLPRFLAIYLEREEYPRFFGALGLILGTLMLTSSLVVVVFYLFPEQLTALAGQGPESVPLLFIVILLLPLKLLDEFLTELCATFSKSRAIFVRRYILHPLLLVALGVSLVVFQADVLFLAYGFVIATLLGTLYYGWTAVQIMIRAGLFQHLKEGIVVPVRAIFAYAAPLMTDSVGALILSIGPLMLGYHWEMDAVAMFQVVMPLVAVAEVVKQTFALLFKPTAARFFARGDVKGLDGLYWKTATWVAVLGFPAFAVTFTAAEFLTVLFFGERYQASGAILSILVFAFYLGSALGPNDTTVKVVGRMRWIVGINVFTGLATVGLHQLLVPRLGPLGAGAATALTILMFNFMHHYALLVAARVRLFDPACARPYITIGASVVFLVIVRMVFPDGIVVPALAIALTTAVVLASARTNLRFSETFPEIGRFRIVQLLLG